MKKLILNLALIGSFTFGFMSCTQDDEVTKSSSNSSSSNLMVFSSVEEYENLFAEPEKTDEKVSDLAARYGTYSENARFGSLPDTLYPEFLQKILNEDYIVQIYQWLIKVDAANERCLVLETKYKDQYADLANSNLSNANILVYSTEDEVLEMLQQNQISSTARMLGCNDGAAGDKEDFIGSNLQIGDYRINGQIRYAKYGVYFKLFEEAKIQEKNSLGLWVQTKAITLKINIQNSVYWEPKCRPGTSNFETVTGEGDENVSKTYYSSSRGLHKYSLEAQAFYGSPGITGMYSDKQIIKGNL